MTEELNWRLLALNVLKRALQDIVRPTCCHVSVRKRAMRTANEFLFDEDRKEDLRMYTDLAELNFTNFNKRAADIRDNQLDLAKLEEELKAEIQFDTLNSETEEIH